MKRARAMAQPGSASVWGTEGRRFKSCWPDHKKVINIFLWSLSETYTKELTLNCTQNI